MGRYVTLLNFETPAQAEYHREVLENAGIPCEIVDERTNDELPQDEALPRLGGDVMLQVAEEDMERAGQAIEEQTDSFLA